MIVLIFRHKGSGQQKAFILKKEEDVEVVREIVMRLSVYLEDFDFDIQGRLI